MTQATSDALAGLPQVPPLEAAAGRHLLVAPANYAGQGHALAQAVADHLPGWTAANLTISWAASPLRFPCDAFLTYSEWAEPGRRQWVADSLLSPASHVLLEDLKPVIDAAGSGPQASRTTKGLRDARALLASGRRVAVLLHGSSARTPGRHRTLYPFSPFGPDSEAQTGPYAHLSSDIQAAIQRLRLPVFVTTPDMLDFVEGAHWVPSVLMAADFAPAPPWAPSGRLKVAHAPSRSIFKGSRFVDAALERLDQAGVIEYVRLSGVPPLELP
ncbi:MAG: hypothetical protein LBR19_03520, partial [Bifidobacteriaceae bacterium]|nr:hypothetical protein [Bifidobacteriaceae bacterium]